MRDFETLFKEGQFYIEADRRIGGNTLYFWYKDLSLEERELLNKGIAESIKSVTESFENVAGVFSDWGARMVESFRLGLENNFDENC